MQKLKYLLLTVLLASACSTPDELPEGLLNTVLTVGEKDQPGLKNRPINTNYFFDQVANHGNSLIASISIDLDGDGITDLQFELSSSLDSDEQEVITRAINQTQVAVQGVENDLTASGHEFLSLVQFNTTVHVGKLNWVSDQPLFLLHRNASEFISAGSVIHQVAYLPIKLKGQLGWVEFQLLTDAGALSIWGVNVKSTTLVGI